MKPQIEKVELCPQDADPDGPFFQVWYSELDGLMKQPQRTEYKRFLQRLNWEIEQYGGCEFRSNVRRLLQTFQPGKAVNTHWRADKDGVRWLGGIMTKLADPPPTSPFKNFEI